LVVIHEPVLEISCGQKQCAQTDTRRWSQDLAAYGAQVISGIKGLTLKESSFTLDL